MLVSISRLFFRFSMFMLASFMLAACDQVDEYTSSSAGQEFVEFVPGVQAPTTTVSNTSTSSTNTTSNSNSDFPSLARTGIVWKPVSEGDRKLVILTPTSLGNPTVTILNASGESVERGRYVGRTNGNRATYRFSRPGRGYSAPALLRVGSSTYLVSSPANRYN